MEPRATKGKQSANSGPIDPSKQEVQNFSQLLAAMGFDVSLMKIGKSRYNNQLSLNAKAGGRCLALQVGDVLITSNDGRIVRNADRQGQSTQAS